MQASTGNITLISRVCFLMSRIDKMNRKTSTHCFLDYSCAPLPSCLLRKEELLRKGMCTEFKCDSYGGATALATTLVNIVLGPQSAMQRRKPYWSLKDSSRQDLG